MKRTETALLIDIDGVICQNNALIAGAMETLHWLERSSIRYLFVTNTTSIGLSALCAKLKALGLVVTEDQLLTPTMAANGWLCQQGLLRAALFVNDEAKKDFKDIESVAIQSEGPVDAVVIGDLGEQWSYPRLNQAFRFLMQSVKPELIALGMTRYWMAKDGLSLDVAPFIKALEFASDCSAVVLGKPAPAFFQSALDKLGTGPSETLMIGDDIKGDVDAAERCGIGGILVKTGKFRDQDLGGDIRPLAILNSIADLPEWWMADS